MRHILSTRRWRANCRSADLYAVHGKAGNVRGGMGADFLILPGHGPYSELPGGFACRVAVSFYKSPCLHNTFTFQGRPVRVIYLYLDSI